MTDSPGNCCLNTLVLIMAVERHLTLAVMDKGLAFVLVCSSQRQRFKIISKMICTI